MGENNHSANVPEGRFNWLFMDYGNLKVTPTDPHWKPSKMHEKFPFKSIGFRCIYMVYLREDP